jgi:hypothetical protein
MAVIKFLGVCDTKYRPKGDGNVKRDNNCNDGTMSLDQILNTNSKYKSCISILYKE